VSTIPNPDDDLVERAERAIRAFEGERLNRAQAERLLSMWSHYGELNVTQKRAVLTRFPRLAGHAWWPVTDPGNDRHVWTCTCGHTVYQPFGAAVPDELIAHPQEYGQLRGGDRD
jgi:hypothetical protein